MWLLLACTELRPARTCSIDPLPMGSLRAEGTLLLDEEDRVVTLRGVNAGGRSKFAPYRPYDSDLDAYLDRPERWGFDVLRVPFSWAAMEPEEGAWDEEHMSAYDALLDGAAERNLWTIVDFHQDVYTEAFCGDGFPGWTLPEDPGPPRHDCPGWFTLYSGENEVSQAFDWFWADTHGAQTAFAEMWRVMATRHADRPGVLGFELMNEPHRGELGPFFTDHAARVQAIAPEALAFVDTTGTDGVQGTTSMTRPEGDNLVFAPHAYSPGALFGGGLSDVTPVLESWAELGEDWQLPVLIGEFGITADHDADIEAFAASYYDAFDRLGMHGTWWEYSDSSELWNQEDLSLWMEGPREEMLAGVVRPYVRRTTGSWTWDGDLLRLEGGPGVHELSLPGDFEVRARGACIDGEGPLVRVQADEDFLLEARRLQ